MIIVSSISNFEWYQNYFKRQLKKQSIVFYDFLGSLSTDTKSAIDFLINIEKVRILNVAFNYSCFIQMFECIQKYLKINSNNWIDLSKSPKKRNSTEERLEELKSPTEFDVDDKLRSFCMKFKMFIGQKNIQILIILRNNFKNFYHHIKKWYLFESTFKNIQLQ